MNILRLSFWVSIYASVGMCIAGYNTGFMVCYVAAIIISMCAVIAYEVGRIP